MAKNKKSIIDLKSMNLSYEDRNQTIKLINFKPAIQRLDVEIYENEKLIKKDIVAFAHIPKKIKAKLNPLL